MIIQRFDGYYPLKDTRDFFFVDASGSLLRSEKCNTRVSRSMRSGSKALARSKVIADEDVDRARLESEDGMTVSCRGRLR